jgi:hypothetical protein
VRKSKLLGGTSHARQRAEKIPDLVVREHSIENLLFSVD